MSNPHLTLLCSPPSCFSLPLSSDIDECAEGKHYCRENTMCVNTPGSFMCICHTGYIRIDDYSCTGEFLCWPFDRRESSTEGSVFILALSFRYFVKRFLTVNFKSYAQGWSLCMGVKTCILTAGYCQLEIISLTSLVMHWGMILWYFIS